MTQELQHTPGPVIRRGYKIVCRHSRLAKGENDVTGRQIAEISGLGIANAGVQTATTRLFTAGYNAFDSAARRLGISAVHLAERMQDGEIAAMLEALEAIKAWWMLTPGFLAGEDDMPAVIFDAMISIIAKVRQGQHITEFNSDDGLYADFEFFYAVNGIDWKASFSINHESHEISEPQYACAPDDGETPYEETTETPPQFLIQHVLTAITKARGQQ
jgi:hypothetical protein